MRPAAILETILYAENLAAAERFYGEVLGLELVAKAEGRQVFYRCGGAMLLIFNPAVTRVAGTAGRLPIPVHGATGSGHLCFRASAWEIATWRAHLGAHGIAIEADFEWPGGGHSLYFRDPAGNSIEFAEPRIWGLT